MRNTEEAPLRLSRELIAAVKLHDRPAYRIAQQVGIDPGMLSKWIRGAERVRPQDPRVLAVARIVGVPAENAFATADVLRDHPEAQKARER